MQKLKLACFYEYFLRIAQVERATASFIFINTEFACFN